MYDLTLVHTTPNWHLEALGGGFRDAVKALLGQRVEQTEALKDGNALRIVVRNRRPLVHGLELRDAPRGHLLEQRSVQVYLFHSCGKKVPWLHQRVACVSRECLLQKNKIFFERTGDFFLENLVS